MQTLASDGPSAKRSPRFHGRIENPGRLCDADGCFGDGEFRAPNSDGKRPGFDGPGDWRWYCLDHIRAFNGGYNFFAGMTADEIEAAQRPMAGWERETRAFSSTAAGTPKWADFVDPLDAIGAKFAARMPVARADGRPLSDADRRALKVLELAVDTDRRTLRTRYAELVRLYHPDRNGGDRSHEKALQDVITAYTHLKSAPAFA